MSPILAQFGAGSIGRSFIGQLFFRAGYEIVFIDINDQLVNKLHETGQYTVVIKGSDTQETYTIDAVRAVNGRDREAVIEVVRKADYIATSVGSRALPSIYDALAGGLLKRNEPVDIIIAENMRNGAQILREGLRAKLPADFPFDERVGLVETSIGKMVPIMSETDKQADPLQVFAEPYNTLIVDRRGFLCQLPPLPDLLAVDHIEAYVDRKLFVHNLGHAAAAYLGFSANLGYRYIWQVLENQSLFTKVHLAMRQGGTVVQSLYPGIFSPFEIEEHIDDLLLRFRNRALGDTIYRVGRDLPRKLSRNDRITGAMLLAATHNLPYEAIADVYVAALDFKALDESGQMDPKDRWFHQMLSEKGIETILHVVSSLEDTGVDLVVQELVRYMYHHQPNKHDEQSL